MIRQSQILQAALLISIGMGSAAPAAMVITEWMYNGADGEFVEFTNLGSMFVDMTGWSFDDNSRTAGSFSLSGFGTVQPGESVVLSESDAAAFRAAWGLSTAVNILGGNNQNLGRSDEINLYDPAGVLVDRLTFNDQGTGSVAGPRTNDASGNPSNLAALGANNASQWILSSVGDEYGSFAATGGGIGNPGSFTLAPEPSTVVMSVIALLFGRRRFHFR